MRQNTSHFLHTSSSKFVFVLALTFGWCFRCWLHIWAASHRSRSAICGQPSVGPRFPGSCTGRMAPLNWVTLGLSFQTARPRYRPRFGIIGLPIGVSEGQSIFGPYAQRRKRAVMRCCRAGVSAVQQVCSGSAAGRHRHAVARGSRPASQARRAARRSRWRVKFMCLV